MMRMDERMYKAFQEEMNALESFRISYAALYPSVPLERNDPDVKRLMEAMAFFGARSRLAAERHVLALRQRLFHQFFDYLVSPVPAMALLQARPSSQLVDPVSIPAGSEFLMTVPDGRQAFFRLVTGLRLFPLAVKSVSTLLGAGRGFRILLRLASPFARRDDRWTLNMHITHLNDFRDSLKLLHIIKKHLKQASVVYEDDVDENSKGLPCTLKFGMQPLAEGEEGAELITHPLERERLAFTLPQQDLFMNVELPPSPDAWKRLTICLDMDDGWPRNTVLHPDMFQLFVAPVVNLKKDFTHPLFCEGLRERYDLFHPRPEYGFALHSVKGVYEVSKEGLSPLMPGIVSGSSGSYEMDYASGGSGGAVNGLILNYPEAFDGGRQIAVEGLWHQPWISRFMGQKLSIVPFTRQIPGVRWDWAGRGFMENTFLQHEDGVLQLVTLMNKTILNVEDIRLILAASGIDRIPEYREAMGLLEDARCQHAPCRKPSGNTVLKEVYSLGFRDVGEAVMPLLENFRRHVQRILNAWVADTPVEVEMESGLTPVRRGKTA
ncbi:hypothetical protein FIM25_12785 [Desulfobotulus mexicanus]|uniref:Type VI secretion system baseplate subunit TssF n=2 Tax=Desulfobotulus mexicanus TaxID=2586642 RepID=A0A5S5ME00_9BACT|nr:hypothetical protein FIM25_12785 [Desulfobotulus mexicanus]